MKIFTLTLSIFISLKVFSQGTEQEFNTLNAYKSCLLKGDKTLIDEIISKDFRFAVYQHPVATNSFKDFIEKARKPNTMYWDAVSEINGQRTCKVHYVFGEKEEISNVVFSKEGKLLYSDYLDQKGFNFNRYGISKKIATFPFIYDRGSIILKAKLNDSDKVLNMLFDTGADGLALKADLQQEIGVKITEARKVFVPGGEMTVNYSSGNTLILDDFVLKNQNMVMFPKIKPGLDGIIGGSNFFRSYITEVNFERHEIILYSFGENDFFKDYNTTTFRYSEGVPTIPLTISSEGNTFESEFILDAGAGYQAIMFGSGTKLQNEDLLVNSMTPLFNTYNVSVGHKTPVQIGLVDSISFAGLTFENSSLAVESYEEARHNGHNVLGSIGIQFLRRFNWVIDLNTYNLYTKMNAEMLPLDFVVNDYLIGFVNNVLVVKRNLTTEEGTDASDKDPLKLWDRIISIEGKLSNELTASEISKLQQKENLTFKVIRKGQPVEVTL
ncbi:retropepsin-like aspartic protease [Aestuariibaculum lutulentum]|uniref:Retroviral-like aspartic protease family protein n=1 Tax=Aestuariibaculum lutulentum TaxID=2920935 RepID=A0ABS9RHW8_9FLAO|nr:retropepsin-like aspartic protease [Aestuariibaculum lutulentum]MCH4552549.1 retroviral-like aspartic protease family protein [Aestuariibaculum lutulentum]